MKKTPLLLTLLMLMCFGMAKAEIVLVGDGGTSYDSGLPSATNWKYGVSQQIYTAEEIGKTGTITSIAFKSCVGSQKRLYDIFLKTTDKTEFSSKSDWIYFSQSDKVFSGSVEFVKGEWTTVTFDSSFEYDGTGNLCLIVIDRTGSFPSNSDNWIEALVYGATNQSLLVYNDTSGYDPEQFNFSVTGNSKNYKNQIILNFDEVEAIELGASGGIEDSSMFLPTYSYYNYSMSQQLYMPYEIDFVGNIASIGFYNEGEDRTRTVDLYLVAANKSAFDDETDWIPFTEDDKMFSGSVTFKMGEWTMIKFQNDKRFYRKSSDILAVIMVDHTGSFEAASSFKTYSASRQSMYVRSDETEYTPEGLNEYLGIIMEKKNQIVLSGSDDSFIVGPSRADDLPIGVDYEYSISEQIYTKEEIGKSGTIKSIAFYSKTADCTRNIDLWLGTTSKQKFSSSSDWLSPTQAGAVKVYSGNVTFKEGEWTNITFTTPFKYDGKSNLLVITDDNSGSIAGEQRFYTYEGQDQSLSTGSFTDIDPINFSPYGLLINMVKNRIKLVIEEDGSSIEPSVVEIGDGGNETITRLPTYTYYNYSLTQQIYTKDEMGRAQPLQSIAFYNNDEQHTRNLDIYLVHTGKTSFTDQYDWVPFSEADKVYSGEVSFNAYDWTVIDFDTPFNYSGGANLAVIVDDNTGSYLTNSISYLAFDASNQALCINSDNTNYSADGLSGYRGEIRNAKNQVKFNYVPLPKPTSITVSDVTYQSAVITWESEGSMWNLEYKKASDSEWIPVSGLTSKSHELVGLSQATEYLVRVQIYFGTGTPGPWKTTSFTTLVANPVPIDIAVSTKSTTATISWTGNGDSYLVEYRMKKDADLFFDDFENGFDDKGWTIYTEGTAPDDTGWSLFAPDEGAISGTYVACAASYWNGTAYNADNWLVTPQIDLDGALSFWARSRSSDFLDSYEVLLSTTGNAISDFTTTLQSLQEAPSEWSEVTIDMTSFAGQMGYIAIHHLCEDKLLLFIDDFTLSSEMPYWQTVSTTEPEVTITGLQPGSVYEYRVTSLKTDQENASTTVATFTTLKSNPVPYDIAVSTTSSEATISWQGFSDSYDVKYRLAEQTEILNTYFYEDFEGGTMPDGWTTIDADGDGYTWVLGSEVGGVYSIDDVAIAEGYNASSGLVVSGSYSNAPDVGVLFPDNYLVSPQVTLDGVLVFHACGQDEDYPNEHFGVAVSTTGNTDPSDFTTIEEWTLDADGKGTKSSRRKAQGKWGEFRVDLSAYAGQKGYIAIRHFDCYDQFLLDIDDIGIYEMSSVSGGEEKIVSTTDTQVTLTGLEQKRTYEFQIVGKKAGEEDAATDIASFTTGSSLVLSVYGDNTTTIDENVGKLCDVIIDGRTLKKDGKWWSLCLPFDVELEGSPLEGADIRTAESVTKEDDFLIVNCLTPVTKVLAGIPYIIKWDSGEDIVNPEFKSVTIKGQTHPTYLYGNGVVFNGIYSPDSDSSPYFYILNGDLTLGHQSMEPDAMMYAFECFFWVQDELNSTIDGIGLNVGNFDETIVGIKDTKDHNGGSDELIYNLAGQRMSKSQKGVNITKGRKVLVK